ncbi:MAG: ABC transporter substrate-binding protein [Rhodospirillales bacterium]|nr:ABC transporter substrate-binding protein [Rhodospirillales bacterium]MDE2197526.1 ABC transporter substrate-binding protein [Rhodospirillales bacterium]MDE2575727.1 ABC transporter substrate-binding protein [Rhodospirillales bacterium]
MFPTCRMVILGAALAALTLPPAARAQTLRVGASAPVTSIDPHYHTYSPNVSLDAHIYEPLVDMDAASRPIPRLALSWKLVDNTVWEFHLRPGVKFHNGEDFTAADVAYTIDRIPRVKNSPGSYAIYTKAISSVEVVDPHTIRLHTKQVYPLLPIDLTQVYIIPHTLGADPATEDFNSGKDAIGTGPFRFVSYKSGDRIEMDRNDNYWGPKPDWQHVSYRMIPNDAARTAALLSGDVDFIEAVPTTDVARLSHDKKLHLAETVSLRIIFLWLDHRGMTPHVTGPNGEKLDHNPLTDLRVRQALSMAINRNAIVDRIMQGAAIPSGQFLPKGSFSYVPGLNPPAYDPAKARQLLAAAGYPKGFRIELDGPNDRYVNDGKIIQAVGQMWSRIGVQTAVNAITWPSFIGQANKGAFSAFLLGWGTSSGEASNPLRSLIATRTPAKGWGAVNRGFYSNPKVDELLTTALATADDAAREKLLQQATTLAMDDVAFIPLHNQKNIWAMRAGLTYAARADETSRAQEVHPAK